MNEQFDPESIPHFARPRRGLALALVLAAIGLAAVIAGWLVDPSRTAFAYLAAFVTCLSAGIGALIFLATIHAMNAKWPVSVRRLVEGLVFALVPLTLAFIPIALTVEWLYPWAQPHEALPHHLVELLEQKRPYFELGFFWGRAGAYFAIWLLVAIPLLVWSARQDRRSDPSLRVKQRVLGAASLPILALSLTFASFDWVMSLDPAWYSTIFGVYVFAGGFVAALALLTIATYAAERRGRMAGLLRPSHYYALGRLLLAFTIFWAYIAFFQFMLIWIANKPEEVAWYIERLEQGWAWVAIVIIALRFVVPFLALLSYKIKWRPRALSLIAAIIVVAHWLEVHWIVVPALHVDLVISWIDVGAILLLGGGSAAFVLWWLGGRAAAPRFDQALPKGARYHSV